MNFEQLKGIKKLTGKKENIWIILLMGVLFMVVAIPSNGGGFGGEKDNQEKQSYQGQAYEEEKENMEQKLEELLGNVEGAGKVKVMLTYKTKGEKAVEKDEETEYSQKETETNKKCKESTVFAGEEPFVYKEYEPEIQGVVVVAQGGDNTQVKKEILEAIKALFDIEAHKIKIIKAVDS